MNHNPKVFIHYSWDSEKHKNWTLNLASRLISDGIDVIFDQYDLKLGANSNYFMEQISMASKVIIIMTPGYKAKVDKRTKGVGYEYQIISNEIAKMISSNNKYIPILRDGDVSSSIPVFLESFLFLDIRENANFEIKYIELLKNIYELPIVERPKLGKKPNLTSAENGESNKKFDNIFELGLLKEQVNNILGVPDTYNGLCESYWSHGLEVFYNKHDGNVDGLLAKRQPSGISFEYGVKGIYLGETFAEIKAKIGNPINWGLPNAFTSFAFYKINDRFLTIAIWRDVPDKEYPEFKIGTAYAIAYCKEDSVIACEPIVAITIEEIRSNKKLSYLEKEVTDYAIDFKDTIFNEDYIMYSPYPFLGGGYMVTLLFKESNVLVDFWLYDLAWSYLVIRMITKRDHVNEK